MVLPNQTKRPRVRTGVIVATTNPIRLACINAGVIIVQVYNTMNYNKIKRFTLTS